MNKAKAVFSGAMILVIAGASGVCWYLNDKGIIGKESVSQPEAYVEYEDNNYNENANYYGNSSNNSGEKAETTTTAENKPIDTVSENDINEFLTVFAKVYFSENTAYNPESRSTYELIRFAYSHIKRTEPSLIKTIQSADEISYYSGVPADEVNAVLEKYLGVTVPHESVYTENDYSFFKYSDELFLAPAADGLPFVNTAVCDKITETENTVNAQFSVFSNGEVYATGEAKIEKTDTGLILVYYNIEK